jgi:hypothetical protein
MCKWQTLQTLYIYCNHWSWHKQLKLSYNFYSPLCTRCNSQVWHTHKTVLCTDTSKNL